MQTLGMQADVCPKLSKSRGEPSNLADFGLESAEVGPNWSNSGQMSPECGQLRPNSRPFWPGRDQSLTEFARSGAKIHQSRPNLARARLRLARHRPNWGRNRPKLARNRPFYFGPKSAKSRPSLASSSTLFERSWTESTKTGKNSTTCVRVCLELRCRRPSRGW